MIREPATVKVINVLGQQTPNGWPDKNNFEIKHFFVIFYVVKNLSQQ